MNCWSLAVIVLFLSGACPLFGQHTTSSPFEKDTVLPTQPDSLTSDTLARKKGLADTSSVTGIDTVITYSSTDSIVYTLQSKTMAMYSKADIKYQRMRLQAARIDVDWSTSTMTAYGRPDTIAKGRDTVLGSPIMNDAGEEYHGKQLGYNFKTKRGRIQVADTHIDQGYYHGERIKKVGQDVLFVADGRYTTCDKADPDYFFFSPKMKVTPGDKVIAEPVLFYISDVPIFWLPLAVFPNKSGRRSGIIAPAIAEDATHGRLLHHLGYYFALSDYMDLALRSDLYTKGSWAAYGDYRYSLRYNFNGSFSGNYKKLIENEPSDPSFNENESYVLAINHHQEIDPTMRADVNFTFASNNSFRNTIDLNEALNQTIASNATISKYWEGTPNSINLSLSRTQNLLNGNITQTLPSMSYTHSQSYPFRFGRKGADESNLAWYEMIGVSYNANASNYLAKTISTVAGVRTVQNGIDTTISVEQFAQSRSQTLGQFVSLNIAPKLGHFSIGPQISYSDQRSYMKNTTPQLNASDSSTVVDVTSHQTQRSGLFSSGVGISTKFYGMMQPNLLGIAAFRHTVTPSLSFTYSKQVIGENLPPKQMVMSFNVGNIFEMKTRPAEEGKEGEKIQLLNLGAGVGYNFSADSLNFSLIGLNYRTNIARLFDIGGGANFDLYKLDEYSPGRYNRVNRFLLSEGRLARLTNFSFTFSTSLSGERKKSKTPEAPQDTLNRSQTISGYRGLFNEEEPDFSIPWRLSLNFDYAETKLPNPLRSAGIRGGIDFNLTENWKFRVDGGYDIANRQVVIPHINVSRDLHCWEMTFNWVPIGFYRSYQFEIRLKAPQLQDIKVTKQGSETGIY